LAEIKSTALPEAIIAKSLRKKYISEPLSAPLIFPIESLCLLPTWTAVEAQCFVMGRAPEGTIYAQPSDTWVRVPEKSSANYAVNFLFERELFRRADTGAMSPNDWVEWCDANLIGVDSNVLNALEARRKAKASKAPETPTGSLPVLAPLNSWRVVERKRFKGYIYPLYLLLKTECDAGKEKPNARNVIEAWKDKKPSDVSEVMDREIKYYDSNGNIKSADLKAIQQAIKGLILDA
jgi:hypothetical protein